MILVLRDDNIIELFESTDDPPGRLEAIDVENGEYRFCDEAGQCYRGVITREIGVFSAGAFRLEPEGRPELKNVLEILNQAVGLEVNKWHADLESLRRHLIRS